MLKNTVLNTGSSLLYFFVQWLTTVLVVRFCDFSDAGIYALAISFSNIFYFLVIFGIRNYQVSDVTGRYSDGQYAGARLLTACVFFILFLITLFFYQADAYSKKCYFAYMLFKLGEAYTEGYFSILQKRALYGSIAMSYLAKALIPGGCFAVTLILWHDLFWSIVVMTIGYAAAMVAADLPRWKNLRHGRPSLDRCFEILYHSLPLLLSSLSIPVMNYITRHAVEMEMSNYWVGQYSSLSSVIVVMTTFAGAAFVVMIPEVSEWAEKRDVKRILRLHAVVAAAMLGIGILSILAGKILGPAVCSLIFGREILESIDLLIPLLITSCFLMIKSFFSAILTALGRRRILLVGEGGGAALCAASAISLTQRWGMQGANYSYLLGIILQLVVLGAAIAITLHAMARKETTI